MLEALLFDYRGVDDCKGAIYFEDGKQLLDRQRSTTELTGFIVAASTGSLLRLFAKRGALIR